MSIDPRTFPQISSTLRSYMHLSPSDPIDLVLFSAILSNFTPDRVNPLWFVLVAPPESGKSMLLDVLVSDWPLVWTIQSTPSPSYFLTGRVGHTGILTRVDKEKRRILHMNDMAGLLPLSTRERDALYTQLIAIYDGHLVRETALDGKQHVHKRPPRTRLGWCGAATEAFYDRFLRTTATLGARFTPYYWQPHHSAHWTSTQHLPAQRSLRGARLNEFKRVRSAMQAFLDHAVYEMDYGFNHVVCPPAQSQRIDAATSLVMRVCGASASAPGGGRTADRAVQFARTAAFIQGMDEVEQSHGDIAVQLVLSQMHPNFQRLIAYASQPAQLKGWFTLAGFLRSVGAPVSRYELYVETLVDIGVLDRNPARGKWEGSLKLSADALKLVSVFNTGVQHAAERAAASALAEEPDGADDPSEIAMDQLEKLEAT